MRKMNFYYYGIDYKNTPLTVRETLTLDSAQQRKILHLLGSEPSVNDAMILNTCGRLEFYLYAKSQFDPAEFIQDLLADAAIDTSRQWQKFCDSLTGTDVVRHIFCVAAGLDSQMLGENQVLTQLKAAYCQAHDCKTIKFMFHRLLHSAFRAGKAVRSHTDINCGAVSIALAAVELAAREITLTDAKVLILGAGENAELIAKYLSKNQIAELIIANRSSRAGQKITEKLKTGRIVELAEAVEELSDADLLIASTAAKEPLITKANAWGMLDKRNEPVLMIDIAVPRDIDPALADHKNVRLFNIEDLNERIEKNTHSRFGEIPKAQALVAEHVKLFENWLQSLNVTPVIAAINKKFIETAHAAAARYAKDFDPADSDKLAAFAESLAKKLLHGPVSFLKNNDQGDLPDSAEIPAIDLINKILLSDHQEQK